jgi:hypothetical protein
MDARRTTHQPVSEHFRTAAVAGTHTPKTNSVNAIFGLGVLAGACIGGLIALFIIVAGDPIVHEGDRVCVAMILESGQPSTDAYYCGPVVFTPHDELYQG